MIRIRIKDNLSSEFKQFAEGLENVLMGSILEVRDRVASRAVILYMREAGRERSPSGGFLPRSPSDSGPLRALSGRLASGILAKRLGGSDEGQIQVVSDASGTRLVQRVAVPYANIQEKGGVAGMGAFIPARPYIAPSIEDVTPEIPSIFDEDVTAFARSLGLA